MFVHKSGHLKLRAIQAWWPENLEAVRPLLNQAPVVMLWQCPEPLVTTFRPWTFRSQPFFSPLIDLSRSEEELWQKLEAKSCRYEIRKAQKLDCVVGLNEEVEAARLLINSSIRRLRYREELGPAQWHELLADHDIFMCRWQGIPVAAHVMLRDFPGRARLLLSGSEDRSNERLRGVIGPANRLLHWHEIQHYKAKGVRFYDFGGCDLHKDSPEYPITQFKLSFGGEVVTEPILYLAKNPGVRAALKGVGAARSLARKIPWPKAWLQAVRSSPKLKSLFR